MKPGGAAEEKGAKPLKKEERAQPIKGKEWPLRATVV